MSPLRRYVRACVCAAFAVLAPAVCRAASVTVDAIAPALIDVVSIGEWNLDGDLEGWIVEGATGVTVSGGVLAGSADAAAAGGPKVQRLDFPGGPECDLGFHDTVEMRIQVPAQHAGGISFLWGTTTASGISREREVRIDPAAVPDDGAFHTYRIDMGLEPAWSGTLRDVRIDPLGDASDAELSFALDYVRVGSAEPEYLPNYIYYDEGEPGVNDMVSKHFRIVWGDADEITMSWGNFTTNSDYLARGNLRNMEDQWQVYTKLLGYREPSESVHEDLRDGTRYKVNLYVGRTGLPKHSGGGYFMGYDGETGFGWLTIDTSGLRVDPPSWVNPHELGHVFQVHQTGYNGNEYMGFWWECHANWLREHYLGSPLYPEENESGFGSAFPRNAHFFHGHGRHYYDHWPIWSYLEENPDGLPCLGPGFTARLWQEALPDEYIYAQLARQCPEVSVKDLLGYYVRRNATWDYANRSAIWDALGVGASLAWDINYRRLAFAELIMCPDDPAWWRVPIELAPMQGAYNIIELAPEGSGDGRTVSVDFRTLPLPDRAAEHRACLVAVDAEGDARYGSLWSAGAGTITLSADETRLFLTVVATPDTFVPQEASEVRYPYATHPGRVRFPYEVSMTGAAPLVWRRDNEGQSGARHPFGGGFVASTAQVDATAYVGPNALVLDRAQVRGNARIEDYAVVEDSAYVGESAVVSGHARVQDEGRVVGHAKVRGFGEVRDDAVIGGRGRVLEHGTAADTLTVTDWGVVKGYAYCWADADDAAIAGNGICDGDYAAGHSVRDGVLFGWLISADHAASRAGTLPGGLYAGYEFDRGHPSLLEDSYGVTHGYLRGSPAWLAKDEDHEGVLALNGADQYGVLPRSVSDLEDCTVSAWVKWGGGAPDQRLCAFGSSPTRELYLTPRSAAGRLACVIAADGAVETLSAAALPAGVWKHVALVLEGDAGRLYVDGAFVAEGTILTDLEDLNAPDTGSTPQANYVGRGQAGGFFSGLVDGFRIHPRGLSAVEAAALALPPPVRLIPRGAVWKYRDSGENLGTAWRLPGYDDAAWAAGPAQLGFGDGDEATAIADENQITSYFRRSFAVDDSSRVTGLDLRVLRDDGAVVYLNGEEVFRSNMPEGAIAYATLAVECAVDEDETVAFHGIAVDPAVLVTGENLVAVEVHQCSATSSDVSFDLELAAALAARRDPLFRRGDVNGDDRTDIADPIAVLGFLFASGPIPSCRDAADANDDGNLDIADAVAILGHLFAATGPLPEPANACGPDPASTDALDCQAFAPCM